MHIAARLGNLKLMELIHKLDTTLINSKTKKDWTVLHSAVVGANLDAVKFVHEKNKEQIKQRTKLGLNMMHLAMRTNHSEALIRFFHHLDPELIHSRANGRVGAMHIAAMMGNLIGIRTLYELDKALVLSQDYRGKFPVSFARENHENKAIELLEELMEKDPEYKKIKRT